MTKLLLHVHTHNGEPPGLCLERELTADEYAHFNAGEDPFRKLRCAATDPVTYGVQSVFWAVRTAAIDSEGRSMVAYGHRFGPTVERPNGTSD